MRMRRSRAIDLALACLGALALAMPLRVSLAAEPAPDEAAPLKTFRREFVDVTPGRGQFPAEATIGSAADEAASPPHAVRIGYSFAMARYEVPQNLWQAVMGRNPSRWKGPRNAAEMFSYDEAEEFCRRATRQMRELGLIGPRQIVRLPSEAEWEYCARAGSRAKYAFGDNVEQLDDYAWSHRNAAGNDPPVGAKRPNAWGLYDLHGYLWEWCADAWHDNYQGAPADGSAWTTGGDATRRVLRGGSWKDPAELLASHARRGAPRITVDDAIGLRAVLADEPGK